MPKQVSNVIIHALNFQPELDRIIPRMREISDRASEWATYHPRASYGYVDAIDHSGLIPVPVRYALNTEGVGSKIPVDKENKLEVPWYGQNGLFEQEPPWNFSLGVAIVTTYGIGLEDFENGSMTLDKFIWNEANLYKWEAFFSTKEVIGWESRR
jgi:hypothetical protein|tara:strand:- start:190 stop:654 length:465 start_codon:yes stop_codon:yes gene_type:complete